MHLGDAVTHQPGPGHEDALDLGRHAVDGTRGSPGPCRPRRGVWQPGPLRIEVAEQPIRGGVRVETVVQPPRQQRGRCGSAGRFEEPGRGGVPPRSRTTCASARARRAADDSPTRPTSRCRSSATSSSGTPSPVAAVVIRTSGRLGRGRSARAAPWRRGDQHRPKLRRRPLRTRLVALVDDDQVGDLEQPGLDRLDLVAHLGRLEDDGRVRGGRHLDLALPGPDGLDRGSGRSRRRPARPRPRSRSRRARRRGRATPSSG